MITRRIGRMTMPSIFHYGEAADADFYIAAYGMSLRERQFELIFVHTIFITPFL